MSRLTKRHGKYAVQIGAETRRNDEAWLKLAYYEDLEEQGRLIELPCKVGDKLYDISEILNGDDNKIFTIYVAWITIQEDKNGKIYFDINGFDYYPEDIGEVVFLTKAEAEAKLAELKEGGVDGL